MRGLLAQLSSNEEITLRRVALSIGGERLPVEHIRRLKSLELVEEVRGTWRLTPLGRHRYAGLERPLTWTNQTALSIEVDRILAKHTKTGAVPRQTQDSKE
jgi:hypothetical protein